ncbi:MAG: hypothetical protein Q9181_001547 [Wetmoreana brouardii]
MEKVDVLICGAGPVGLLTAYCLARYGLSTYIVEQHDRAKQIMYGRASMIAPRCLEMLEQLDLVDPLIQTGFVVRGQMHYNKDGERVEVTRFASSNITDTFYDYLLLCRQKYTEEAIHEGYRRVAGQSVHYGTKLLSYKISEEYDDYKVLSTLETQDTQHVQVESRYIVGADGARSTVREIAGIDFQGEKTNHHFIRIDGIVITNMPEARSGVVGIESASHGSVFWACLDHRRTRVGFAFPEKLWRERGANLTQEDVVQEAQRALQPFTLEFECVDWWTAYSVSQRLASKYRAHGRVLIAGDAAHTHSSAAAQGMNTGIHDAVNLSWKLAGLVNGLYTQAVLDSYSVERRYIAAKIIEQDRVVASLTAGQVPKQYRDDPTFDRSEVLTDLYKRNQALNAGIGVSYLPDGCTIIDDPDMPRLNVFPGERAPDVLVQRPGMRVPVRLYTLFKNVGKFTILLLCGNPTETVKSLKAWSEYLGGPDSYTRYQADLFQSLSIVAMPNGIGSVLENSGIEGLGPAFYDVDGSAHGRYGVAHEEAAVFVLRPDGTVGCICRLPDTDVISNYFARLLKVEKGTTAAVVSDSRISNQQGVGEVDVRAPNGGIKAERT